jgi:hypothetical protein
MWMWSFWDAIAYISTALVRMVNERNRLLASAFAGTKARQGVQCHL